jgi:hypothetical protein
LFFLARFFFCAFVKLPPPKAGKSLDDPRAGGAWYVEEVAELAPGT